MPSASNIRLAVAPSSGWPGPSAASSEASVSLPFAAALAGAEEHVAAVGERARPYRRGRLLRQRIAVDAHTGEVGTEVGAEARRDPGIDRRAAAIVLDGGGRRVVDRRLAVRAAVAVAERARERRVAARD
jgi:hypothetical protein